MNKDSFGNLLVRYSGYVAFLAIIDYSGPPAHLGRSSAQLDRASAHLMQSAVQPMLAAVQHTS